MTVHATALVAPSAVVPVSSKIGPYCIVGPDVVLGEDCELVSHVIVDGHTVLGARNRIFPFSSVGIAPQDLKYKGEPTRLTMADDNTVRECVTISRGTAGGGGLTQIGSHCLIMAYTHIGHDSIVGDHCILANGATLAGHVVIEDYATVGAQNQVHQFCRIGRHAYTGGGTTVTQDVLPFSLTSARRETHAYSLNKVGLERRGFSKEQLRQLHNAYRFLLAAKLNTSQAIARMRTELPSSDDNVQYLIDFIEASQRGIHK